VRARSADIDGGDIMLRHSTRASARHQGSILVVRASPRRGDVTACLRPRGRLGSEPNAWRPPIGAGRRVLVWRGQFSDQQRSRHAAA